MPNPGIIFDYGYNPYGLEAFYGQANIEDNCLQTLAGSVPGNEERLRPFKGNRSHRLPLNTFPFNVLHIKVETVSPLPPVSSNAYAKIGIYLRIGYDANTSWSTIPANVITFHLRTVGTIDLSVAFTDYYKKNFIQDMNNGHSYLSGVEVVSFRYFNADSDDYIYNVTYPDLKIYKIWTT